MTIFRKSLFALFLFSQTSFAQHPVQNFVNDPMFKSANISLLVRDLNTGKNIYSHRAQQATIPASTMKVITTAAALEMLGPDFRYETLLWYDGSISKEGILNGNLYVTGSGDPTLGSNKMGDPDFLSKWVEAIRNAGIKKINGKILADDTRFDNEGSNPKWTWDDIGNYYATGIYALAYKDNTMRVTFKSGAPGSVPEIINVNPEVPDLKIDNNLRSGRITFDSAYFYGSPKSMNRSVRGEIPANSPSFTVLAELPNPGLQLAIDLREKLISGGISVSEKAEELIFPKNVFPAIPPRTKLYVHLSPPLSELIRESNQHSNNLYTEQIFKSICLSKYAMAGNTLSVRMIRDFWKSKGLDVNQLFQEDGSGLSPTNAVSAGFFVDVMTYMYKKSAHKATFMKSLSVAGKSGTIAGMFKKTFLEGRVFAKSGTISRVRSYTGYIQFDNAVWAFAVMVNNSNGSARQTQAKIEELILNLSKK